MAEEFREGPHRRQKPAGSRQERSGRRVSGAGISALVAIAVVVVSAVAWYRWERPRELTAGIPMPRLSRIVPDGTLVPPPGQGCRLILRLAAEPAVSVPAWEERIRDGGWEPQGTEEGGDRLLYVREGIRLRVGVELGERATRLRLTFRPCPAELSARTDTGIVHGES